MVRIKPLSLAIAGAACVTIGSAVTASSAQALVLTNNFRVDVTQGLLKNQSFFGNFRYDDASLTGSGLETLDPSNGFQSLSFKFLGNTYTQSSDSGFPEYPQLNFKDGSLLGLDYAVESLMSSGSIASFAISYDFIKGEPFFRAYNSSPFDPNTKRLAEGTVKYGIQAVPTPALLPGLIGLGLGVLRKRRAEAKEQLVES